jgi:hypothetical protein
LIDDPRILPALLVSAGAGQRYQALRVLARALANPSIAADLRDRLGEQLRDVITMGVEGAALTGIPLRPSWLHGSATRPSICTGWPTVTFGSPATVTAMTSPPEVSSAISWTCHNGKPVSRSVFAWPVSNAIRGSGARVHTNDTPAVSILSFICSLTKRPFPITRWRRG